MPFLLLPPEVRDMIYYHLFSPRSPIGTFELHPWGGCFDPVRHIEPAMAQFEEVRDEVMQAFFRYFKFRLRTQEDAEIEGLATFLSNVGNEHIRNLRDLDIMMPAGWNINIQISTTHQGNKPRNTLWGAEENQPDGHSKPVYILRDRDLYRTEYAIQEGRHCLVLEAPWRQSNYLHTEEVTHPFVVRLSEMLMNLLLQHERAFLTAIDIVGFVKEAASMSKEWDRLCPVLF